MSISKPISLRRTGVQRVSLAFCVLALLSAFAAMPSGSGEGPTRGHATTPANGSAEVLDAAFRKSGVGYAVLTGSGVSKDVRYKGELVLRGTPDGSSYCCGFTFEVVMEVLEERGMLESRSFVEVKRFQKQWYGSEPGSAPRQVALAMEEMGVGRQVRLERARAGDFAIFSRTRSGHSVILLDTIKREGRVIGFHYRSSQPGTNGVGNVTEYFTDSGYTNGTILRDSVVVARLNER